jgi:hypothetical protein
MNLQIPDNDIHGNIGVIDKVGTYKENPASWDLSVDSASAYCFKNGVLHGMIPILVYWGLCGGF